MRSRRFLTEYNCQYLILNKSVPYTGDPQKNGLTKIADIEAYELYRNEAVEICEEEKPPGYLWKSCCLVYGGITMYGEEWLR